MTDKRKKGANDNASAFLNQDSLMTVGNMSLI